MRIALAILVVFCISLAYADVWSTYKKRFGKKFKNAQEEKARFGAFKKNFDLINQINNDYYEGKSSFAADLNEYSSMLPEEQKARNGFIPPHENSIQKRDVDKSIRYAFGSGRPIFYIFKYNNSVTVPKSIDWRTIWKRPVLDQGLCGSCWAFATASIIDSAFQVQKNITIATSQEDMIDCSGYLGTGGCNGASQANALEYAILNGTALEASYPYTQANGTKVRDTCNTAKRTTVNKIKGFVQVEPNEEALKQAVAKYGPCTVSIEVTGSFYQYKTSVYNGLVNGALECSAAGINHAVVVVGYGTDATYGDYWIVRNTWGTTWGDAGHIKMKRNVNLCGIREYAYCAVVDGV